MIAESQKRQAKEADLFTLVGKDVPLRKIASTRGGEFAGACPRCGGHDRLHVQPQQGIWMCRQCHPEWTDAIGYVKWRDCVNFAEAVRRLAGGQLSSSFKPERRSPTVESSGPPCEQWQRRSQKLITYCEAQLWSNAGAPGREYLHGRGLLDNTLKVWRIGYNPKPIYEPAARWGMQGGSVRIPAGVVIPGIVGTVSWYIKLRNLREGGEKYPQVRGSHSALFGAHTLGRHDFAVITEGEFDTLITWQTLQHATNPEWRKVGVASMGSAEKTPDLGIWARSLWPVRQLLVCLDNDAAGNRGTDKWLKQFSYAARVLLPNGVKDLNDYHLTGGRILDLVTFEILQARWKQQPTYASTLRTQLDEDWRKLEAMESQQGTPDFEAVAARFAEQLTRYEQGYAI